MLKLAGHSSSTAFGFFHPFLLKPVHALQQLDFIVQAIEVAVNRPWLEGKPIHDTKQERGGGNGGKCGLVAATVAAAKNRIAPPEGKRGCFSELLGAHAS